MRGCAYTLSFFLLLTNQSMTIERLSQLQKEHANKIAQQRKETTTITILDKDGKPMVIVMTPEMKKSRHMREW